MMYTMENLNEECMEYVSVSTRMGKSSRNIFLGDIDLSLVSSTLVEMSFNSRIKHVKDNVNSMRIKSISSMYNKYERYVQKSKNEGKDYNASLVLNDLIGIRFKYPLLEFTEYKFNDLYNSDKFKIVNLVNGKKDYDGYRAIHIYIIEKIIFITQ